MGRSSNTYPFLLPKAENIALLDTLIQSTPLTFGSPVIAHRANVDLLILAESLTNDAPVFADWGEIDLNPDGDKRTPIGLAPVDHYQRSGGAICVSAGRGCEYGRNCHSLVKEKLEEEQSQKGKHASQPDRHRMVSGVAPDGSERDPQMFFALEPIATIGERARLDHNILFTLSTSSKLTIWNCLEAWLKDQQRDKATNGKPRKAMVVPGPPDASFAERLRNTVMDIVRDVVETACRSKALRTETNVVDAQSNEKSPTSFERISAVLVQPGNRWHPANESDVPDFQTIYFPIFTKDQITFFFRQQTNGGTLTREQVKRIAESPTGRYFRGAYDSAAQSGTLTVRFPRDSEPKGDLRASCPLALERRDQQRREIILGSWEGRHGSAGYAEIMVPIHVGGAVMVLICAQIDRNHAADALTFYGDVIPVLANKIRASLLSRYLYEVLDSATRFDKSDQERQTRLECIRWVYPFERYELMDDGIVRPAGQNTLWDHNMVFEDPELKAGMHLLNESLSKNRRAVGEPSSALTREGRDILKNPVARVRAAGGFLFQPAANSIPPLAAINARITSSDEAVAVICRFALSHVASRIWSDKMPANAIAYHFFDPARLREPDPKKNVLGLLRDRLQTCIGFGALDDSIKVDKYWPRTSESALASVWQFLVDKKWFENRGLAYSGTADDELFESLSFMLRNRRG